MFKHIKEIREAFQHNGKRSSVDILQERIAKLEAEKGELLAEKKQLQDELDKYKSAIIEVDRRAEIIKKAL